MNKRKKVIAEHALSLFVEKGISQTSIQDILDRASISKGTFYNHFSSKHECVSAILEQARYDATLMRAEFIIGKDPTDDTVLAEQITVLSTINRARGLDVVFEEILHSGDSELKQIVLEYRMYEIVWLANRFQEVWGVEKHGQAIEAAIIFFGMMQHISFTRKMIHQKTLDIKVITNVCLLYMKEIVGVMVEKQSQVLDAQLLENFVDSLNKLDVTEEEVVEQLAQFHLLPDKTKSQQEITEALLAEFQLTQKREVVIDALLRSFGKEFTSSPYLLEAKEISSLLWYIINQRKRS